jgi:hypothetical protein
LIRWRTAATRIGRTIHAARLVCLQNGVAGNGHELYFAGAGSSTSGALYSFGASGSAERALGSVASGTPGNFAYGVRFTNDTALTATNITISYTGEQWRNGGNTSAQKLAFSYLVGSRPAHQFRRGERAGLDGVSTRWISRRRRPV